MSEEIIQKSIKCLANSKLNETTYEVARDIVLEYLINLQQKVEQLEKELTLMVEDDERSQETIINQSKRIEQLEKENKRIFQNVNDDELLISNAMNYAELKKAEKRIEQLEKENKELKEELNERWKNTR